MASDPKTLLKVAKQALSNKHYKIVVEKCEVKKFQKTKKKNKENKMRSNNYFTIFRKFLTMIQKIILHCCCWLLHIKKQMCRSL